MEQINPLGNTEPCPQPLRITTEQFVEIDGARTKPNLVPERFAKQHKHPRDWPGAGFDQPPAVCLQSFGDIDMHLNIGLVAYSAVMQLVRRPQAVGEAADQLERRVGVDDRLYLSLLLAGEKQRVRIAQTDPSVVRYQRAKVIEARADITRLERRAVENLHGAPSPIRLIT